MFKRLLFGLIKGLLLGAAIGALLHFVLGAPVLVSSALGYIVAMLVGATAGVFSGQPPWRKGAWIGSILKGIFGLGIGAGLYALLRNVVPQVSLAELLRVPDAMLQNAPLAFAPAIAGVYSMLVEIDDGGDNNSADPPGKTGVRVGASAGGDEDEVEEAAAAKSKGAAKR